nr:MAG TPA: hypothetical protein [Bacteriophage sp.]
MLTVYLKPDHAIRPVQERGKRLFRVRREVIGSIRKTRQTGSYTPFPR